MAERFSSPHRRTRQKDSPSNEYEQEQARARQYIVGEHCELKDEVQEVSWSVREEREGGWGR